MTTESSRQTCPVCDGEISVGASRCPKCHTDLRLLAAPANLALDFYNEGLDLARAGNRQAAIDKMHGAIAANSSFVDAYIVLGKLHAQSGGTTDLTLAVAEWQRARKHQPTPEQADKLDNCIETAARALRSARSQPAARQRTASGALAVGGLVLAAACGVAGYVLHPATGSTAKPNKTDAQSTAANVRGPAPTVAVPTVAAPDPVSAINQALARPDISAARVGDKLALRGSIQSEGERDLIHSAAAYAAHTAASQIDVSDLKVIAPDRPVAAKQVEHMLHSVIAGLGRGQSDPLSQAKLGVTGGTAGEPLKVKGTVISPRAGDEIVRLIKDVYPSTGPVDISGILVRPVAKTIAPAAVKVTVLAHRRKKTSVNPVEEAPAAPKVPSSPPKVAAGSHHPEDNVYINLSTTTYTVQPGDTIFAITQKYKRPPHQWNDLWQANRQTIRHPNSLPVGTVLKLPQGWAPPKNANDADD
jgi:LysM repeat protein